MNNQVYFQWLLTIYVWLLAKAYGLQKFNQGEVKMHYIVKNDNPNVKLKLELGKVTDAEGEIITDEAVLSSLTKQVVSSDTGVVTSTDDGSGTFDVGFGRSGTAGLNYEVRDSSGNVLAAGGDTFTVTTGDPKAISSITGTFDGLTPVDETPTEPVA